MVQHILARFLKRGHHQKRFWRRVLVVPQLEDGTSCASQLRNTRAFNHDKCTSINYNNSTVRKHICCIPILKEGKPCFFPILPGPSKPTPRIPTKQPRDAVWWHFVRPTFSVWTSRQKGRSGSKPPREGSRQSAVTGSWSIGQIWLSMVILHLAKDSSGWHS